MPTLPTGTVTFLFTDIEGSTRLLQELAADYGAVQDDHARLMREAIARGRGLEIRTEGDAFFVVFPSASGAVETAVAAQQAFAAHPWTHGKPLYVRMGMHTGEGRLGGDDYLGIDVNRAARVAAAAHGGQVLMSETTRTLVERDLPEGITARDLGAHRLKDIDQPERICELLIEGLPVDHPPLKSLEVPTNLPTELSSFVGREQELDEIEELLGSIRLLTLTGPGGSGKTRLALRAAGNVLDRFPDGVFFIELASTIAPHLVPSVIASGLRTGEQGPRPVMETLQIELRHQTTLLVLDNFEQVIDAGPLVGTLLTGAPRIRSGPLLVTKTRIRGEQEFPVSPLELPDPAHLPPPEALTRYEALALFVERATAIDPRFSLHAENGPTIVEICRRLDGLPLAIELAVSRLRLMSPAAILARLDRALPLLAGGSRDLPARQRTLRNTIAWSYDLLSPDIAAYYRRLCVFAGGFTLAAAESVGVFDGESRVEAPEGIEALLDTGLVRRRLATAGDGRFEMLQTVREYGLELLEKHGESPAVRRSHAKYFLDVAERAAPGLRGPDLEQHLWLLSLEHDNLRAALTWLLGEDEGETALRLGSALWRFWHLHGDLTAGRSWVDQALALPSAQGRTTLRVRALIATGSLAYWQLDVPAVETAYTDALAMARELKDSEYEVHATYNLAYVPLLKGNLAAAAEMFRSSRALFEDLRDRRGVADSLFGLSIATRLQGNVENARAQAEEGLRLHRELGDVLGMHGDLYVLGSAAVEMGDVDTARELFLETMGMAEHMENRTGIALSLDELAHQETARGNALRAMRLAGASEAIKESVGGEAPPELLHLPDLREAARRIVSEEELQAAWDEGRAM